MAAPHRARGYPFANHCPARLVLSGAWGKANVMKSCLIVDDSSIIRKVARRFLEDMDFVVDEAEDGQDAYDKCTREMPDVILLDWQMPVMGGLEFLKALRGYAGGDKPAVIYCTTERDIGHIAMARKAGANDHMLKPFDQ